MSKIPEGATHEYKNWEGMGPKYYRRCIDGWECYRDDAWRRSEYKGNWLAGNLESISDGGGSVSAPAILEAAAGHMKDRAATYDKPAGERSMGATVQAFEAVTGVTITEEQGWLFMQLLKAVRSQQGAYRADSYEDGAAYVALAGEAAARDRA